jgi:hypothetical protein
MDGLLLGQNLNLGPHEYKTSGNDFAQLLVAFVTVAWFR